MDALPKGVNAGGESPSRLAEGRRVAAAATVATVALVVAKGTVGTLRGSPALTADAVHSAADALAIFASWLGLRLADRPPTKRFPFGLYRAETLASLVVSAIILVAGVEMFVESGLGLVRAEGPAARSVEVLAVALLSAVLSLGISVWEKRVGERLGSQSLLANADESRADILTSLAVFVGTAATYAGMARVELVVAAGISLLIIWLGLKNGRLALYALLDASLDPALEAQTKMVAAAVPGVKRVEQIRLRRAGPFLFGIAHIEVHKTTDVARGHELAHRVISEVRADLPQIEMLTVHLEPFQPAERSVMVPAEGPGLDAQVSPHFARAQCFQFATVSADGIQPGECVDNVFKGRKARAGLAVVKDALEERAVDAVVTREIGEIAFHTLRDGYVEVHASPACTVREALDQLAQRTLPAMGEPTHPSEAAAAPIDPSNRTETPRESQSK